MDGERTREEQYHPLMTVRDEVGIARLGLMTNESWHDDPRPGSIPRCVMTSRPVGTAR